MNDEALRANLDQLGVGTEQWRAVALLPLVAVAWADGRIQPPERARILAAAHDEGLLTGKAGAQIRRWLTVKPTIGELELALLVIEELVRRQKGPGADFDASDLERIEQECLAVARAAGGLLDLAFTVDSEESKLLADLHERLRRAAAPVFDDLPTPDSGSYDDL